MTKSIYFVRAVLKRKANKSHKRRLQFKNWQKKRNQDLNGLSETAKRFHIDYKKRFRGFSKARVPRDFSFRSQPEAAIKFISRLEDLYTQEKKTFVVLRGVASLDYEAIVVLLSVLIRFKAKKITFSGDLPLNPNVMSMLEKSEFFYKLYSNYEDRDEYEVGKENKIWTRGMKKRVDVVLTAKIVENAAKTVWGEKRRCQGVQNTLNELMVNTWDHADINIPGNRHWWLSVNHDRVNKVVSFSFIDYGVGIFTSLNNKKAGSKYHRSFETMMRRLRLTSYSSALEKIMDGEMHATTIENGHYRGRGLPGLKTCCERNQIRNLHIVTNNVSANVSKNQYSELNGSLNGTFVYFELASENLSSPFEPIEA